MILASRRARPTRHGAAGIYLLFGLLLAIPLVGLALDYAYITYTAQQLQAAADAAALAGANVVAHEHFDPDYPLTREAVLDVALANQAAKTAVQLDANFSNDAAGDVVVGVWDAQQKMFTPNTFGPNAVKVTARRTQGSLDGPLGLIFGAVFGVPESAVSRTAIARAGGGGKAAVIILHPTKAGALDLRGNSEMAVPNNIVQVNSSNNCALTMNGPPFVPRLVTGGVHTTGGDCVPSGACLPEALNSQTPIPDPLAGLPYPDKTTMPTFTGILAAGDYSPGYYPKGASFNSGVAKLAPGVYVLGPPGIDLHGSAQIHGSNVMLFVDLGGQINTSGVDAGLLLSAPDSGVYAGIVIFQHRSNTKLCDISGTGVFDLRGTLYVAGAPLEMDGTPDRLVGRIIVWTQLLRGTGRYIITGEGIPTGPENPYLVH